MNKQLMPVSGGVVAHCVESFPKLSETFIHGKVSWLLANGHQVRVVDKWKGNRQYQFFPDSQQQLFRDVSDSLYPSANRLSNRVIRCLQSFSTVSDIALAGDMHALQEVFKCNASSLGDAQRLINELLYYRYCRRYKVSVAHIHFAFNALEWIRVKHLLGNKLRLIVSMLGGDLTVLPQTQPRIYADLFSNADLFLASSNYLKGIAQDLGCPGDKIIVHPVEIDTNLFSPSAIQRSAQLTILSVGRLVWEKNYETALRTMRFLHEHLTHVDWQYRIVGDGPLRDELQAQINSSGLNKRVRLLGSKTHEEVVDEMRRADLFFMPSVSEGLGASALEAAACGLPVVASRVGGLEEVVLDGRTGFLAEPHDHQAFAAHISRLLANTDLRISFGFNGRARVMATYSSEILYRRLPEYYWGTYDQYIEKTAPPASRYH